MVENKKSKGLSQRVDQLEKQMKLYDAIIHRVKMTNP